MSRRYNYYGNNSNKGTPSFAAAAAAAARKSTKTYNTAKCPENQKAVDELVKVREKAASSNFGFTVKRAIESVVAYQEPITSYQQALTLKFVGPTLAKIIAPKDNSNANNTATAGSSSSSSSSSNNKARRKRKAAPEPSLSQGSTSTTASVTTSTTTSAAATTACRRQRQRLAPPNNNNNSNKSNDISSSSASTTTTAKTAKQAAYDKAVKAAEDWKTTLLQQQQQLTWKVVLLIDGREQQSDHMQAKCLQSGIPTEERHLPIGDMAWMAQGYLHNDDKIQVEFMLGTIMERKTTADLKASLFGTRYAEQRLRLQQTGLPQVLFLIEGDLNADLFKCPADTLHSAMWETRLHLGFRVVQTAHMDDTVRTLKRMHRRILQRTFPQAFQTEALPTFAEAGVNQSFGRPREDSLSPVAAAPGHNKRRRRHRRRRIESLVELSFDTNPTPMPGMTRFMTYQELKAKVEMDRHEGTRSVGKLHLAMLKQVSTVSSKKCHAVARQYPTASLLLQAYEDVDETNDATAAAKRTLLANLATADPNATTATSARDLKIGPRSAEELYIAYGFADPEDEAMRASRSRGSTDSSKTADPTAFVASNQHHSALSALEEEVDEEDFRDAAKVDTRKPAPVARRQTNDVVLLDDDDDDDDDDSDDDHHYETKENASNTNTTTPTAAASTLTANAASAATCSSRKISSVKKGFLDMSWDTSMDITPSRFPSNNVAGLASCGSNDDRFLLDLSQNDDEEDSSDEVSINQKSQPGAGSVGLKKDSLNSFSSFSFPSRNRLSKSVSESTSIFMDGGSDDDAGNYFDRNETSEEVEIIELE